MSETTSSPTPGTADPPIPRANLRRDPVTVVNPERRGQTLAATDPDLSPNSSVVRFLFPTLDEPAPVREELGLQLGHFRIVERIRTGGMGAVFRALDTRLNRLVAVKVLPPDHARDPASVQRFRNEAQAAAQLDHENIARVYYIGEDQGLHFIAFEFVHGTNVRELIQQHGRLSVEDAVAYTLQIASALAHTSTHGVVHRDIKPSNVIVTRSGRAKLVDLGLARNENADQGVDLTAPGTTLGTFDYISPEQAYDPRSADVRSDIYSLGCTLYHMLTGDPPYPEGTVMQKLLQHKGDDAPDPTARNRRVPESLAAITRRMMAKDPARRYQSAEELIQELMLVAGALGLRSVSSEGLIWISSNATRGPFWERHLAWMATLVVLVAVVAYLEFRPGGPAPRGPLVANVPLPPESRANPRPRTESQEASDNPQRSTAAAASDSKPAATETEKRTQPPPPTIPPEIAAGTFDVSRLTDVPGRDLEYAPAVEAPLAQIGPQSPDTQLPLSAGPALAEETNSDAASPEVIAKTPLSDGPIPAPKPTPTRVAPGDAAADPIWMITRGGGQAYASLGAACAAADDGAVIELRYNGIRQEAPLRVTRKISIVAGRGFRPAIEFLPRNEPASGVQTRMITLASGSLEIVGVDLAVTVDPNFPADFWALFQLQRPENLRLKGVTLTLRNPKQVAAAAIELPAGSTTTMPEMNMEMMARPPLEIDLAGCFVRGTGDLVIARNLDPVRVAVGDSIVALQGSLLQSRGDSQSRLGEERIDLRLDHVTASLSAGLIRLDGGSLPRRFLPMQVTASNCIMTTPSKEPLVAMSGAAPAADFRRLLVWSGRKNFYDQYSAFWSIASADSPGQPETLGFRDWQRVWGPAAEVDARAEPVVWLHYWENRPFAELVPNDFALDRDALNNPAVAGASTRNDAGADLDVLDRLGIPAGRK